VNNRASTTHHLVFNKTWSGGL